MDLTSSPIRTDELPWMPLTPGIFARPLWFGEEGRTLQLKVEPGVSVGRHRHTGEVHAYNVRGSRQLGNGEIAAAGDYVYEPPGNADCWMAIGEEPCVVQITLSGRVVYLADDGSEESFTDTAKLKDQYLSWCRSCGHKVAALGIA